MLCRSERMDGLRGLAVLLMVVHHFLYDLAAFCGAPWWLFSNPVFTVLHYLFAGLFLVLSGVRSTFSRPHVTPALNALACPPLTSAAPRVWTAFVSPSFPSIGSVSVLKRT